jgi:hypothetical protein
VTDLTASVTSIQAEIVELEASQKLRLEEMAFYTALEDLYSQIDVLWAAQQSAYGNLDKLYNQLY